MRRICGLALVLVLATTARGDEPGLTLSDLGPYRAAIEGKPEGPAEAVTFRELWEHPEAHRGRRVRVEGRVMRRFRQGAFGTFPPLVEAWAVSTSGDPFCLVFPARAETTEAKPGAVVAFEGVFLRSIAYQGGDVRRLAPLIVGDRSPTVKVRAPKGGVGPASAWDDGWFGWALGLAAAGFVVFSLARRRWAGPLPGRRARGEVDDGMAPEFVEPGAYNPEWSEDEGRAGP